MNYTDRNSPQPNAASDSRFTESRDAIGYDMGMVEKKRKEKRGLKRQT